MMEDRFLGDDMRKARKEHKCNECNGTIHKGDAYRRFKFVDVDEQFWAFKQCPVCAAWYNAAWSMAIDEGMFGEELPPVGDLLTWLKDRGTEHEIWRPNPTTFGDIRAMAADVKVSSHRIVEALRWYEDKQTPFKAVMEYLKAHDRVDVVKMSVG